MLIDGALSALKRVVATSSSAGGVGVGLSFSSPAGVVPAFVDERLRAEDLLAIKYKAMKHVSVLLSSL